MSASSIDWPKGLREPDMPVLRAVVDAIPSRVSLVMGSPVSADANWR